MPGFFSKMGAYMAGAGRSAMGSKYTGMAMNAAMSRVGRGAMSGAAMGGVYGAMSDDTSVMGGAMGGALMGAGAARYGGAGLRRAALGRRGIGVSAPGVRGAVMGFGKGVYNAARMDYRGTVMAANKGYGRIRGLGSRVSGGIFGGLGGGLG